MCFFFTLMVFGLIGGTDSSIMVGASNCVLLADWFWAMAGVTGQCSWVRHVKTLTVPLSSECAGNRNCWISRWRVIQQWTTSHPTEEGVEILPECSMLQIGLCNAFLKVSVLVSTNNVAKHFRPHWHFCFVLFSAVHTIAFSFANGYFLMCFYLLSPLKCLKMVMEGIMYDTIFLHHF